MVERPKYSCKGGYTASSFERFNLPPNIVTVLVATSNASLAEATWSKDGGLTRLVRRIEQFFNMQLPSLLTIPQRYFSVAIS